MEEFIKNLSQEFVVGDINSLLISLCLAIVLSTILRWFYIHFGLSNTNRRALADNFILLAASVTLIIFMIKSSIALSLGLVGALSIVRFRAAIKEPEELVFLFFNIAVGLGLGAEQWGATLVTFAIVLPVIYIKKTKLNQYIVNT